MLHVHFCIQEKQNLGTTTCLKTLGTELIDNMCQKTALSTALSIIHRMIMHYRSPSH